MENIVIYNNEIELFEKLKSYPDPRPFVCDGNPLECNIFIVGINPATEMEVKFEEFWNKEGFNKQKWLEAYKIERVKAPLKNGKKKARFQKKQLNIYNGLRKMRKKSNRPLPGLRIFKKNLRPTIKKCPRRKAIKILIMNCLFTCVTIT